MDIRKGSSYMSKYDRLLSYYDHAPTRFDNILTDGEKLIWSGKPKKWAFIINKSVVMLPFALIWLLFDGFFIYGIFSSGAPSGAKLFLVVFFAFHLLPVWMWLVNVLSAHRVWENTLYGVTDRRILIHSGFIGMMYQSVFFKDIQNVNLHIGVIDRLLDVGDIIFDSHMTHSKGNFAREAFLDLEDAVELYPKLQKLVMDIQTDIYYPNDLRPRENKGYQTEYKSREW